MNPNKKLKFIIIIIFVALCMLSCNIAKAYNGEAVKAYNEGIDLSKKGYHTAAIVLFKKAISIDPSFNDAYYNLGSLYDYLGNHDEAISTFEELIKKIPDDQDIAFKLVKLYYNKGEYNKALIYDYLIKQDNPKYQEAKELYENIAKKMDIQNKTKIISHSPQHAQNGKPSIKKSSMHIAYTDFSGPTGITKDKNGNLYVANFKSNSIIRIAPDGTPNGKRKTIIKGSPLNGPIGLAVDSANNIYVANYFAGNVIKINPAGKTSIILKGIEKPYYLYIDNSGTLYLSEQGTNTIIKIK